MRESRDNWISVHVHHHGDLDAILTRHVAPITRSLIDSERALSYFFIRYWNGGPHLRLRILPNTREDERALAEEVAETITEQIGWHPAPNGAREAYLAQAALLRQRSGPSTGELEAVEPFHSDSSVEQRDYEFEAYRFGGWAARGGAEALFFESSEIARAIVGHTLGDLNQRLGWAILLMAVVPFSLGLAQREAVEAYDRYAETARHLFPDHASSFPTSLGFPAYEQRADQVQDAIATAVDAKDGRTAVGRWRAALQGCVANLNDPLAVAMSHLHMMNNRLGVPMAEELYLAHLLARGFEQRARRERESVA
jgi:hypothetical protein